MYKNKQISYNHKKLDATIIPLELNSTFKKSKDKKYTFHGKESRNKT